MNSESVYFVSLDISDTGCTHSSLLISYELCLIIILTNELDAGTHLLASIHPSIQLPWQPEYQSAFDCQLLCDLEKALMEHAQKYPQMPTVALTLTVCVYYV